MMRLVVVAGALAFAVPAFAHGNGDVADGPPDGAEPAELVEHEENQGGAHGHGGHAGPPHVNFWEWSEHAPPIGWYTVNFVVFLFVLVRFTKKPLAEAMKRRHDSIQQAINDNQSAYEAAKLRHDTYRTKLAQVDQESRELIERNKEEGAAERDRIITGARDYAKRLRSDAESVAKNEEERARLRLQSDVATAALKNAEEMLRRGLTDTDRDRLFEQSLHMIEHVEAREPPRRTHERTSTSLDGAA